MFKNYRKKVEEPERRVGEKIVDLIIRAAMFTFCGSVLVLGGLLLWMLGRFMCMTLVK